MSGATPSDAGLASGLVNTTAQVGGALGLAVLATVSASRSNHLAHAGTAQRAGADQRVPPGVPDRRRPRRRRDPGRRGGRAVRGARSRGDGAGRRAGLRGRLNQALESGEVERACVPLARREEPRRRRHPCLTPGSRLGRGHAPRPSVCRPRSARRPDPGARRVSTGAGPQAGPGRRTARRASPRTRPDAPPPRPATVRPSESRAPPLPRHRPGRLSPEVPRSQGSRCERGTPSAPAIRLSENLTPRRSVSSGSSVWLSDGGGLTLFSPVDRWSDRLLPCRPPPPRIAGVT